MICLVLVLPVASAPPAARTTRPAAAAKRPTPHPFMAPKAGFRAAKAAVKKGIRPAMSFAPIAGTNLAPNSSPAFSLSSPTVNVIFHGPNWTAADQQTVLNAVQSILSGPYLSALNQPGYGSDGKAVFGTSSSSNATLNLDTPFQGGRFPSQASLDAFMKTVSTANNPNTVNVAVNDTTISQGTVGVNAPSATGGEIYVGTRAGADGSIDKDAFTELFSHEIAEAMTSGVQVTDPGGFKLGTQICDNEPEVRGYYAQVSGTYTDTSGNRVSTTNMVQAYWSQKDGAFIVPTDVPARKKPAVRPGTRPPARPKR
jgi:hypothetical protein